MADSSLPVLIGRGTHSPSDPYPNYVVWVDRQRNYSYTIRCWRCQGEFPIEPDEEGKARFVHCDVDREVLLENFAELFMTAAEKRKKRNARKED